MVPVREMPWPPQLEAEEAEAYPAAVMARICEAALQGLDGRGLLLNYNELPGAVFSKLSAHFECRWPAEEEAIMRAAATRNAKKPGEAFRPDSRRKQSEATPCVREMGARFLGQLYRQLEARRAEQS
jgi:hypothetical protein